MNAVLRARPRFPWMVLLAAVPAFAALIALGTWQVQRLAWKENLLATIDARLDAAAVDAALIEARVAADGDIRYTPVRAGGVFDHARERHFFATHRGASGYFVYTPFLLDDGRHVLVNRGFVPFDRKAPDSRPDGQVRGAVTVTGLARERLDGTPSFIVPDNDLPANIFYWKDWAAMVDSAGLDPGRTLPFFIDADDAPNPGGLPIGGVTRIDLPNNHLHYAITWYGLAAALVAVVIAFVRRRLGAGVPAGRGGDA